MASSPQYTAAPRLVLIQCSVANPNLDGTGTMGVGELQAGPNGSRLDRVIIKAVGSTTAGMIRLFGKRAGVTAVLAEFSVGQVTRSKTVPSFEGLCAMALQIPAGVTVHASTENGEPINVWLECGDY